MIIINRYVLGLVPSNTYSNSMGSFLFNFISKAKNPQSCKRKLTKSEMQENLKLI